MVHVTLLAINARYNHSNLALFYFKRILDQGKISHSLEELTIKENMDSLLEKILLPESGPRPSHIVLSVYIWNSSIIQTLVSLLKSLAPEIKIILGGPEVSYNMAFWLNEVPGDYYIKGAGEPVILPILRGELPPGRVDSPGIPLDEVPFPYSGKDLKRLKNRLVYYETSRGCPFKCSYCLSSCEDQRLEFRSMELLKKELKILAFSEAKIVKLVDRSFNVKPERARKIWQYLLELQGPVPFHFEIHPSFLGDKDFSLLTNVPSKAFHFEIGIQSTSSKELDLINRKGYWNDIKIPIQRLLEETSIPIHLDQIVGLPGADRDSVIQSFNHILSLRPQEFQMGFLKVLPGTPLEKEYSHKIIHSLFPPYKVLQTEGLSFSDMVFFQKIEDLLNSYYNSGLFKDTMDLLFSDPFPYKAQPFLLFQEILEAFTNNGRARELQWAKLAAILWNHVSKKTQENPVTLKDALRRDWAPLAQGQYIPEFLAYGDVERIKSLRRTLWNKLKGQGNISSGDFKRGILLPMEGGDKPVLLSIPTDMGRHKLWFNSQLDEEIPPPY